MQLSLSMIVRNAAEQLESCLASVAGFVDEMVVVDTGSTDATVAVAEHCGAVVHHLPWPGDFAPARNAALQLVRGEWVLVLDADEQLQEGVREPLRRLLAEPDVLVINLLRHERGARQSPYSSVSRLFRRHPAIRWSRPYHSMIDDSVLELLHREPHWRIVDCSTPALIHDGYRPELLAGSDKATRLRQAMEEELQRHPGDPYACAKLGSLEVSEGHIEKGIALLETGLQHCANSSLPERYELLLHLAMATTVHDPTRAEAFYRQALELPLEPRLTLGAKINLASLLQGLATGLVPQRERERLLAEAAQLCRQATATAPELALGWASLGQAERQRGQLTAAISAYDRAIQLEPHQPTLRQNQAAALLLAGDIAGARTGFRAAIDLFEAQGQSDQARDLRQRVAGLVRLDP